MDWSRRLRRLFKNPLVVKDGLSRVRSWRAPLVVAVYLLMQGLFALLIVTAQLATTRHSWGYAQLGGTAFTALVVVQLALVCLFAPALAAGTISGERERQTLDVLLVTLVSPFGIVWGKLVVSVAFILLLVIAALPVLSTVFLFGGIDLEQFVICQLLILTTALALGAVSLFLSALFRRTLLATVVAYALAFGGTAGTWIVGTILTQITYVGGQQQSRPGFNPDPHPLLWVNPIQALVSVLSTPQAAPLPLSRTMQLLFLSAGTPGSGGPAIQLWQTTLLAQLIVVALCIFGAVQLLHGRRRLLLGRRPHFAERGWGGHLLSPHRRGVPPPYPPRKGEGEADVTR
jgi:ABC-type transport system involved in multi-copper enzyme maturation permease subunit